MAAQGDWLNDWMYRKSHVIEGSAEAGTNYQIRIIVHRTSGVDDGQNVYIGSNCRPDFGDIRFASSDGVSVLDYWLEEYTSSQGVFWIEIAEDLSIDCTIYVYYGSPSATSSSSGSDTFIFFDDFEDGTLGKWDVAENNWNVQATVVKNGEYAARGVSDSDGRYLEKTFSTSDRYLVHAWIRESDVSDNDVIYYGVSMDESSRHIYSVATMYGNLQHYEAESWSSWPQNSAVASNAWYRMEFALDLANDQHYAWKDRVSMGNIHLYNEDGNEFISVTGLRLATYWAAGDTGWVDDYYVRKWVPNEPSGGVWGIQEQATTAQTTTSTTTITSTGNQLTDGTMTVMVLTAASAGALVVVVLGAAMMSKKRSQQKLSESETTYEAFPRKPSKAATPPRNPQKRAEVILGALKSYPRVSILELSRILNIPEAEIRQTALTLIASERIRGTFDRTTDEFVSAEAARTGRETRPPQEGLTVLPSCPFCGSSLDRPLGHGETAQCSHCGRILVG